MNPWYQSTVRTTESFAAVCIPLQLTHVVTARVTVAGRTTVTLLTVLHHAISTVGIPTPATSAPRVVKQAGPFVLPQELGEVVRAAVAEATFFSDSLMHEAKGSVFTNAGRVVVLNTQVVPKLVDHERRKQEDIFMMEGFNGRCKAPRTGTTEKCLSRALFRMLSNNHVGNVMLHTGGGR